MKPASISQLKAELQALSQPELITLCLRLARFKAENKELLSYLLFDRHDEILFVKGVKQEVEQQFAAINYTSLHYAKKTIRKTGRMLGKYIRFSGEKRVEADLLIHFCQQLRQSQYPLHERSPLLKFYLMQLQKIERAIGGLHPDLQFDYRRELETLENGQPPVT